MQRPVRFHAFDGQDLILFGAHRQNRAGMDRFPVHQHRAAAAVACLTPPLGAGEPELVPQEIQQQGGRINFDFAKLPIHFYFTFSIRHFAFNSLSARAARGPLASRTRPPFCACIPPARGCPPRDRTSTRVLLRLHLIVRPKSFVPLERLRL